MILVLKSLFFPLPVISMNALCILLLLWEPFCWLLIQSFFRAVHMFGVVCPTLSLLPEFVCVHWYILAYVACCRPCARTTCMYYYFTSYWAVLLWYGGAVVCHRYIRSCIRRSVCGSIDLHNNYTSCTVHVSCYVYNAHVHCIYMLWVTSLPFRFYPHSNANHYVAIPLGVLHCEFMYLFAIALCSPGAF